MESYNEFMEDFKNYLIAIKNLSNDTIIKMFETVKQFLDYINIYKFDNKFDSTEKVSLNDIRTLSNHDIYSYIFSLADNNYKQTTRSSKIEYLRSFFEFLYKIKHRIFQQPFKKVNTEKRATKQLPNYLSSEEAKKVINLYKNSSKESEIRCNAIIHLCLNCGLRVSEVSNLNISNIKLDERTFLICGKGNKERIGYINDSTYNALVKYLNIRKDKVPKYKKDNDKLFLTNKLTKISSNTIRRYIKETYIQAGINNKTYSVHTLRHTCATLMLKNGTDIKVIQEILGHSSVETTKIYTHLYDKDVKKAMQEHPLQKFKFNDALTFAEA